MKKLIALIAFISIIACKNEAQQKKKIDKTISTNKTISDADLENAVIYEANIRQYSPEGIFSKFTQDIPQLKQLGVKIIWLMPIYPISKKDRKGSLGSYYAVQNYTKVNPEFGNLNDLKNLVKTAHKNGMFVILDWVANHTGRDHQWITEHPDYYVRDKNGSPVAPFDWTDVAKLDYSNKNLRKAMVGEMQYWLKNANVDGFRCDVAAEVPVDFWNSAIKQLKQTKPVFMLAEAWEPKLLKNGFDMVYGWGTYHIMNEIAQGKKNVHAWDNRRKQIDTLYQKDDILMNFITNHDENSWNGTVKERLGDASNTMLALTYCTTGMPLIYSGQEYGMNKRLRFFDKDTISKTKGKVWSLLEKLGKLKNTNIALNGGKKAASYQKINSSNNNNILIFKREKKGKKLFYLANLSDKEVSFTTDLSGEFLDYINQKKMHLIKGQKLIFKPWEYKILVL
ncbi:alpha-amylase family glycosyl hydrolase [Lutibacter sp.]|uniref:alpha-amylase family glycosyl hydrolase n=1 Tax=Lutibacter sp. TaxID=1925666 RepID=UPI0025BCF3D6|nr:alpha-amylase family glycosyl hydrolase [Lutibacter sp.]MCF6182019.1 alpha-amylase [Lutibacter sp.]